MPEEFGSASNRCDDVPRASCSLDCISCCRPRGTRHCSFCWDLVRSPRSSAGRSKFLSVLRPWILVPSATRLARRLPSCFRHPDVRKSSRLGRRHPWLRSNWHGDFRHRCSASRHWRVAVVFVGHLVGFLTLGSIPYLTVTHTYVRAWPRLGFILTAAGGRLA